MHRIFFSIKITVCNWKEILNKDLSNKYLHCSNYKEMAVINVKEFSNNLQYTKLKCKLNNFD